jgi:hypothetical protein
VDDSDSSCDVEGAETSRSGTADSKTLWCKDVIIESFHNEMQEKWPVEDFGWVNVL